jgi:hypothetical protein
MRRPTSWLAPLALSVIALGLSQSTAGAASVASFRLMNVDPPGTPPVREVLARIIPAGSIVPRNPVSDPPSILDPSTGWVSSGFASDDLQLTLGDGTTSSGEYFQALKLDFGPDGLAPGGKLFFQLNRDPSYDGLVRLVLPTSVTNLGLERLDSVSYGGGPGTGPGTGGPDPGTPPPPQVPEPVSLALWGTATALGLLRARRFRKTNALARAA